MLLPGLLAISLGLVLLTSAATMSLDTWGPFGGGGGGSPDETGGVGGERWEDWKGREERERCDSIWMDKVREIEKDSVETSEGESVVDTVAAGWSLEREVEKGRNRTDVLEEMVSRTKGFYVRDWPL